MPNKFISIFCTLAIVILGIIGVIYYIASQFWAFFLILGAFILFFVMKGLTQSWEDSKESFLKMFSNLWIPFAGIVSAVIIGGFIMVISGYNPIVAYKALFYGGFVRNWHISILNATPLIFTGLSVAFAFNAGLFNIGAEGQYYVGAMAATFLGIYFRLPPFLSIMLIFLLSAALAGMYNFIPAFLKVRTGAHEVITTMMFAHIARYMSSIFIKKMGGDPSTSSHPYVTDPILEGNWLPRFRQFIPDANYRLHIGIVFAIITALFVYYLLFHTKIGFEIRAIGNNSLAAKTQGISTSKNIYIALLFAGFLAGLSGVNQVVGLNHKLFENLQAGYGWDGISVALLASNHPIGVIFTAILWGALDSGGQYMQRTLQTPNSIVDIIKGIILFLIVARYLYHYIERKLRKKKLVSAEGGTT